ncbi:nitrite reductase small subunit NirD [Alteromonas pelagimontana]|uniref:Nitrite reductase small subunit NirD n=1 Tax=Alteromonas pelagimontana TaxID=1858656 RepID=A0A6M4MAZ1_9ALTE|nr:nitrite reductase small subunit NirD [Alteromonas pelagimontana]QJR80342.1 nitrite reductase small subunit NirD [Alteromonas pelagimontana]
MLAQVEYVPQWLEVGNEEDLIDNSGICALIDDQQVAIFTLASKGGRHTFALGNWDPIGKANVLYRGIVGSIGGEPVVASPLYKEHYSLITGKCLENDGYAVPVYEVRVEMGKVQVAV